MSEKSDKLRAMLEKEKERRIKLNNRIEILERRIQEEDSAEVNEMVRTANCLLYTSCLRRHFCMVFQPCRQRTGNDRRGQHQGKCDLITGIIRIDVYKRQALNTFWITSNCRTTTPSWK